MFESTLRTLVNKQDAQAVVDLFLLHAGEPEEILEGLNKIFVGLSNEFFERGRASVIKDELQSMFKAVTGATAPQVVQDDEYWRRLFASSAMNGFLSNGSIPFDRLIESSYRVADAMVAVKPLVKT